MSPNIKNYVKNSKCYKDFNAHPHLRTIASLVPALLLRQKPCPIFKLWKYLHLLFPVCIPVIVISPLSRKNEPKYH